MSRKEDKDLKLASRNPSGKLIIFIKNNSHTIQNNSSNNIDTITDGSEATVYKIHALMKGAWKGNVNNIPDFWDISHGSNKQYAPEYSLSQKSKYVWGYQR